MQSFHVYKNLAWLNDLPTKDAEAAFFECCSSAKWAGRMTCERPFAMLEDLFVSAEAIWLSSTPAEWREVFSAQEPPANGHSSEELDQAMDLYEEKFGFTFIICGDELSGEEILASCRARMVNPAATEIKIAAHEQKKITEKKLGKLLER